MFKYLEELQNGDCFLVEDKTFVLTCDSKKSGDRLCINLFDGTVRWFKSDQMVDNIAIFYTDKESNIISVKETKKDDFA